MNIIFLKEIKHKWERVSAMEIRKIRRSHKNNRTEYKHRMTKRKTEDCTDANYFDLLNS